MTMVRIRIRITRDLATVLRMETNLGKRAKTLTTRDRAVKNRRLTLLRGGARGSYFPPLFFLAALFCDIIKQRNK